MKKKLIVAVAGLSLCVAGIAAAQPAQRPMTPDQMLQRLDLNKDGRISQGEFLQGPGPDQHPQGERPQLHKQGAGEPADRPMHAQGDRRGPPDRKDIFAHLDANGDGFLTRAELDAAPKAPPRPRS